MTPRFSLVYPTRHRPEFVRQAMALMAQQDTDDVEVIVCDNWVDPALSCETICRDSGVSGMRYLRPPAPLGMVDNWNHAVRQANGEYVCVFTDKIFMLPNALGRVARAIEHTGQPEIVSWVTDTYVANAFPDYFGAGTYTAVQADAADAAPSRAYDPAEALARKCAGEVSRYEQTPSEYCRGKMVFGAYHRSLIDRVVHRFGQLFFDVSPDYTSMVVALSEATTACELASSAVVSIGTDISNGVLTSTNDAIALEYLQKLSGDAQSLMDNMLIPGLYASQANNVSHDYLAVARRFGLPLSLHVPSWVVYCIEDLTRPDRVWSSPEAERAQMLVLYEFVNALPVAEREAVVARLKARVEARQRGDVHTVIPGQRHSWPCQSLAHGVQRRAGWS
jgi:hypothetical protein